MKSCIHRGVYDNRNVGTIEWARIKTPSPEALVFILPLIGGNYTQQIRFFRWLVRKNLDIFSFNYSGHGKSSDKFSLRASIDNTLFILDHARRICEREKIPLIGIASCYSSIPLLFASHQFSEPFSKLVLINPLTHLNPYAIVKSFTSYYYRFAGLQIKGKGLGKALAHYADYLFPEIVKGNDRFGILHRKRTRLWQVLLDFLRFSPLKDIILPKTKVLCLYAKNDKILDIFHSISYRETDFEKSIRKICPLACFSVVPGDHFLSPSPVRSRARKFILSFLIHTPLPQEFLSE